MQSTRCKSAWALVDCNNFYASCEKVFRPDLEGRPVVVLSNNDGCIIARSREAREIGIRMGEPWFKIKPFLDAHDAKVFSANFALYGEISSRVMTILEQLCPKCEQYSIDEAFLELDGAILKNLPEFCRHLRQTVRQWTGITISIGTGSTPTLAKLANRIAKKRPDGLYSLLRPQAQIDMWLENTPVGDVWGIGAGHAKKLLLAGIENALALKNANDDWLKRSLTIMGLRTALELRGIVCQTTWEAPERKTLLHSRSFGHRVHGFEELAEAIATFTARCAERMRILGLVAGGIWIRIRTSKFDDAYYANSAGAALKTPTDDTGRLIAEAKRLLKSIFAPGHPYAKAAVMLFDIAGKHDRQLTLFEPASDRQDRLMSVLDRVNGRYGRLTLRFGAMGLHEADWHMRQEMRSPSYMTDWNELPVAVLR